MPETPTTRFNSLSKEIFESLQHLSDADLVKGGLSVGTARHYLSLDDATSFIHSTTSTLFDIAGAIDECNGTTIRNTLSEWLTDCRMSICDVPTYRLVEETAQSHSYIHKIRKGDNTNYQIQKFLQLADTAQHIIERGENNES